MDDTHIKQIAPLNEGLTALMPCVLDDGKIEYFDALFDGWNVVQALLDKRDREKIVYMSADPTGIFEPDGSVRVISTLYCPVCRNRMKVSTGPIERNEDWIKHIKYRCVLCEPEENTEG